MKLSVEVLFLALHIYTTLQMQVGYVAVHRIQRDDAYAAHRDQGRGDGMRGERERGKVGVGERRRRREKKWKD